MISEYLPSKIIDNRIFSVLYKGYTQSKNLRLRYTPDGKSILITGPKIFSQKRVTIFLEESSSWLYAHKPGDAISRKFVHGVTFPFFEENLTIQHHAFSRKSIVKNGNTLHVMNPSSDINDQIITWIIRQAKIYFEKICHDFASKMDVMFKSIHINDPKARWGSCNSYGKITFSWRLALAPCFVYRYVIIHELSHLIEMNHSSAFWKIVSIYDPNYQTHRQWLKQNRRSLHQWGS